MTKSHALPLPAISPSGAVHTCPSPSSCPSPSPSYPSSLPCLGRFPCWPFIFPPTPHPAPHFPHPPTAISTPSRFALPCSPHPCVNRHGVGVAGAGCRSWSSSDPDVFASESAAAQIGQVPCWPCPTLCPSACLSSCPSPTRFPLFLSLFLSLSFPPGPGSLLALPAGLFRSSSDAPVSLATYLFARGEW